MARTCTFECYAILQEGSFPVVCLGVKGDLLRAEREAHLQRHGYGRPCQVVRATLIVELSDEDEQKLCLPPNRSNPEPGAHNAG